MELTLQPIDRATAPAFAAYLMPDAVRALEEEAPGWLFFGALSDASHTCGAAAAQLLEGELQIVSLYVDPAVRRQGIGTRLLAALTDAAGRDLPLQADWALPQAQFDEVTAFLTHHGFDCDEPCEPVYRLDTASLRRAPLLRAACAPGFRPDANVVAFDQWTDDEREELRRDETIASVLRPEQLEGQLLLPLCFGYRYGGRIAAYALLRAVGPREVAFMAALSRPGAHPAAFLLTVAAVLHAALRHFGGDVVCWLDARTDEVRALADQLSGGTLETWWSGSASRI